MSAIFGIAFCAIAAIACLMAGVVIIAEDIKMTLKDDMTNRPQRWRGDIEQ